MGKLYKRESEGRLIKAVSRIIEEDGFSKVKINHIARVAECDKVLIYRYFGGLDGLITVWAEENDFYTTAFDNFHKEIETIDKSQIQSLTKKVLISQLHSLQENKLMQELLIWELTGNSKFKILQDIREKNGHKLQEALNNITGLNNEEISIYITVLIAAIEFLVLYTRQYSMFNGVDFSQPKSWNRFEEVINNYIDLLFNTIHL